jgi:NADP-dependent 3-hydroxy acid dehydrogenase YdfG
MKDMSFGSRWVLVTGASSGVGAGNGDTVGPAAQGQSDSGGPPAR